MCFARGWLVKKFTQGQIDPSYCHAANEAGQNEPMRWGQTVQTNNTGNDSKTYP